MKFKIFLLSFELSTLRSERVKKRCMYGQISVSSKTDDLEKNRLSAIKHSFLKLSEITDALVRTEAALQE